MAVEYVSKDVLKKLQEVEKARIVQLERLNKATGQNVKVVEEIVKSLKENEKIAKIYARAHAEEAGVAFEYARATEGATLKVKGFNDALIEAAKKIPVIGESLGQAGQDPTAFNFSQEIPLIGLKARLLKNIASEVEKAITFFTDDLSTAFSATVDSFTERFQRELFGDIKVYTERLKGRQDTRDEIANALGPLGQYANEELIYNLFKTKVDLFVDPSVRGKDRVKKLLNIPINKFSEDELESWFSRFSKDTANAISSVLLAFSGQGIGNNRLGSRKEEKL